MQAPSLIVHGVVPSEGGGAGLGFGLLVVGFGVVLDVVVVVSGAGAGTVVVVVGAAVVVVVVGAGLDEVLATFWLATAPVPQADSSTALPATVTPRMSFLTRIFAPIAAFYAQDDVGTW